MTGPGPTDGRNSHPLHAGERIWRESNCYVDLWIGLLHHFGLEPTAMLACAAAPHFEGDQWTFVKPSTSELAALYGIRVEELTIWRGLRDHVARQVALGRIVLVEVDGFHLPDTRGVTYRIAHAKTTVGIHRFDDEAGTASYFHNSGHYSLDGDELTGMFSSFIGDSTLPPFAELADVSRRVALDLPTLRARSREVAARRLALGPERNPFLAWAGVAGGEVQLLSAQPLAYFHAWAFATIRQAGAMCELLAAWCEWLDDVKLAPASIALRELSQCLAAQQFRLARVPSGGRRPDLADALGRCAELWARASTDIVRTVAPAAEAGDGRAPVVAGPEASAIIGTVGRSPGLVG